MQMLDDATGAKYSIALSSGWLCIQHTTQLSTVQTVLLLYRTQCVPCCTRYVVHSTVNYSTLHTYVPDPCPVWVSFSCESMNYVPKSPLTSTQWMNPVQVLYMGVKTGRMAAYHLMRPGRGLGEPPCPALLQNWAHELIPTKLSSRYSA